MPLPDHDYMNVRQALCESHSFGFDCKRVVQFISTFVYVRIR